MAVIKILKNGETDIESTDISKFALHSNYKCQKIALVTSGNITLPDGSNWFEGDFAQGVIQHNLGYIPMFFAFVEKNGKGYEATGNANPQIPLASANEFNVGAAFDIYADETNLNITVWPTGLGKLDNDETFVIRVFFIQDEII
jgi:hypothetical protein